MMLDLMGQHNDSKARKTLRMYMHDLIAQARSFIYNKAIPITSVKVKDTLKPMSLVPTLVSALLTCSKILSENQLHPLRMHFVNVLVLA